MCSFLPKGSDWVETIAKQTWDQYAGQCKSQNSANIG